MNPQLNIDYSRIARDKGIERAEKSANQVHESWSEKAYELFKGFLIVTNGSFTTEMFREYVKNLLPAPPSLRAFGGVTTRAAKSGLIRKVGYTSAQSVKSHATPVTLWVKV